MFGTVYFKRSNDYITDTIGPEEIGRDVCFTIVEVDEEFILMAYIRIKIKMFKIQKSYYNGSEFYAHNFVYVLIRDVKV